MLSLVEICAIYSINLFHTIFGIYLFCKSVHVTGHPIFLLAEFGYLTKGDDITQMKIPEVLNKWLQVKKN